MSIIESQIPLKEAEHKTRFRKLLTESIWKSGVCSVINVNCKWRNEETLVTVGCNNPLYSFAITFNAPFADHDGPNVYISMYAVNPSDHTLLYKPLYTGKIPEGETIGEFENLDWKWITTLFKNYKSLG